MKSLRFFSFWPAQIAFILAALTTGRAAESPGTGTLEGHVVNSARTTNIEGARVTVAGTSLEAFTQADGSYRLAGVPAGNVSLKIFYTGFPDVIEPVAVAAGEITRHEVDLATAAARSGAARSPEVVRLEDFVVSTSREMDGAAIAVNEQRFAANTKAVVSTDEFGNVAEGSVGEFLKFLPGVTMDYENGSLARGIYINGVPTDYVPITVNGFELAGAGGGNNTSRGVQLDMVSITDVARMEVIYSPTPDSPASALAGSVNMVSRSAFERSRPEGTYDVFLAMRDNARDFNKTPGPLDSPTRKVWPGFDFSYIRPINSKLGFTISGGRSRNASVDDIMARDWRAVGKSTNGKAFPSTTPDQPYLSDFSVQTGTKDIGRTSFGFGVDYKPTFNDQISFAFQTYYIDFLVANETIEFDANTIAAGGFTPTSTQSTAGQGDVQLSNTYRDRTNRTFTPTLTWRHHGPVWTAESGFGLSQANNYFRAIDKGYFSNTTAERTNVTVAFKNIDYLRPETFSVTDGTTGAPVDPYNINNYALISANSNPVTSSDLKRNLYANLARGMPTPFPFTLKAGVDFREDVRDQRTATVPYAYVGLDGKASTTPVGSDDTAAPFFAPSLSQTVLPFGFGSPQWLSNATAWSYYVAHPTTFTVDPNKAYTSAVSGSKHADELVSSAYLRGDLQFFNGRLKLIGGLRAEQANVKAEGPLSDPTLNYKRDASGKVILTNGSPSLIVPTSDKLGVSQLTTLDRATHASKEYLRYFPSLNASYNIRDNLIARAAYYYSIGRPSFDQYEGGITLPDESLPPSINNVIQVNNASIKPWTAKSLTGRLEYYFNGVGQVSVGGFVRDFKNFFETTTFAATPEFLALYNLDPATFGQYLVQTQDNSPTGMRMSGVDVSYKQALTFLPYAFRGISVFANGSALRATGAAADNLAGFFPRKASWGISLTREKFNVRMNWNYQGRRRMGVVTATGAGPGTYNWESKRGFLDILGEYYFRKNFALYANLRNINDTPDDLTISGPLTPPQAQIVTREYAGSLWTFGIKGRF